MQDILSITLCNGSVTQVYAAGGAEEGAYYDTAYYEAYQGAGPAAGAAAGASAAGAAAGAAAAPGVSPQPLRAAAFLCTARSMGQPGRPCWGCCCAVLALTAACNHAAA